jgi:hypothetical protein
MNPKDIRRFEGKPFRRVVSSVSNDLRLANLANQIRKRGYNARVIKNVNSSSVYVRPRKYNFPIPETETKRIKTFPIAVERALGINVEKAITTGGKEAPLGIGEWLEIKDDLLDEYEDQINQQIKEINAFTDDLKEDKIQGNLQNEELLQLQQQAIDNISYVKKNGKFESNLTDLQWDKIMKSDQIKGIFESNDFIDMKSKLLNESIIEYAESKGIAMDSEWNLVEKDGYNLYQLYVGNELEWSFDKRVIQDMKEATDIVANEGWKRFFVWAMRGFGSNEHSAYWQLTEDLLYNEDALKERSELLNFTGWDGWNLDIYREPVANETSDPIPYMIDLPPPNIEPVESAVLPLVEGLSKEWATEITIKTNDTKQILELVGLINDFSSSDKMQTKVADLNDSKIMVGPNGGRYILVNGKKQYIPPRAFSKKRWVEPRKKHRRYNLARNRIANYIYDEMQKGVEPTTKAIQTHLDNTMKKPPGIEQTGNWLSRDSRFRSTGFEGWPARNKKWSLNPPNGGVK